MQIVVPELRLLPGHLTLFFVLSLIPILFLISYTSSYLEVRKAFSPEYGYTSTEAGVIEPTQYLITYYGLKSNKEDKSQVRR